MLTLAPGRCDFVEQENGQVKMLSFFFRDKPLVAVFVIAVTARLIFFFFSEPWSETAVNERLLVKDASVYHAVALEIVAGEGLSDIAVRRTPGYPAFLALFYSVFSVEPWIPILFQCFLGGIMVLVVAGLGSILCNRNTGLMAGLLFAIEPHAIYLSNTLLTDVVFTLSFLGACLLLLYGVHRRRWYFFLFAGFLLGYAILVRPVGQFLLVPFLLVVAIALWRADRKLMFTGSVLLCVATALVVGPWLVRNKMTYDHYGLSDKGGQHLLFWVAAYVVAAETDTDVSEVRERYLQELQEEGVDQITNPFERNQLHGRIAKRELSQNLSGFVKAEIVGVRNTFLNLGTGKIAEFLGGERTVLTTDWLDASNSMTDYIVAFINQKTKLELMLGVYLAVMMGVTYLLACGGFFMMIRHQLWFPLIVICVFIGYFLPFIGPIGVGRYKFPFMAFYLVPAGYFLQHLIGRRIPVRQEAGSF